MQSDKIIPASQAPYLKYLNWNLRLGMALTPESVRSIAICLFYAVSSMALSFVNKAGARERAQEVES